MDKKLLLTILSFVYEMRFWKSETLQGCRFRAPIVHHVTGINTVYRNNRLPYCGNIQALSGVKKLRFKCRESFLQNSGIAMPGLLDEPRAYEKSLVSRSL